MVHISVKACGTHPHPDPPPSRGRELFGAPPSLRKELSGASTHQGVEKIVLALANEGSRLFPLPWWERVRERGILAQVID